MILIKKLSNTFKKNKISFFTGVPDSVLKNLLSSFGKLNKKKHIIAANEGAAIAIAIGYYLSSKKINMMFIRFKSTIKKLCYWLFPRRATPVL